ncbi:MAG: pyroglutamyl-peptidase I [Oscillospiraceae bacterium]|nr:pyroglutamyl-peptidase I [Oscillospiraceae bacterium]
MDKKLLITAFEPFGGETVNASLAAVSALPDRVGDWEIHKLTIPVVFGKGAQAVMEFTKHTPVDAVLCVGQAAGRSAVTPEMLAINLQYASIPDNEGNCPKDEPIESGGNGREAIFSTMPIRRMAEAVKGAGIPCEVSYSAGTYVCNDTYYRLLSFFAGTPVKVGFLHLPVMPEQGSPSLEPERAVRALQLAIREI